MQEGLASMGPQIRRHVSRSINWEITHMGLWEKLNLKFIRVGYLPLFFVISYTISKRTNVFSHDKFTLIILN